MFRDQPHFSFHSSVLHGVNSLLQTHYSTVFNVVLPQIKLFDLQTTSWVYFFVITAQQQTPDTQTISTYLAGHVQSTSPF